MLISSFRVRSVVKWNRLEGGVVIVLPELADALTLNETGLFIWERIVDGDNTEQMARKLAQRGNIELSGATVDVEKFTNELIRLNVISRVTKQTE